MSRSCLLTKATVAGEAFLRFLYDAYSGAGLNHALLLIEYLTYLPLDLKLTNSAYLLCTPFCRQPLLHLNKDCKLFICLLHNRVAVVERLFMMSHRSILAEAMFKKLIERLRGSGGCLDVQVDSASVGPAFQEHDPRVARLAREAGLDLQPRHLKCFDEVRDMVDYDLLLVMDKFDLDEVHDILIPSLERTPKPFPWAPLDAVTSLGQRTRWSFCGDPVATIEIQALGCKGTACSLRGSLKVGSNSCVKHTDKTIVCCQSSVQRSSSLG